MGGGGGRVGGGGMGAWGGGAVGDLQTPETPPGSDPEQQ